MYSYTHTYAHLSSQRKVVPRSITGLDPPLTCHFQLFPIQPLHVVRGEENYWLSPPPNRPLPNSRWPVFSYVYIYIYIDRIINTWSTEQTDILL